MSTMRRTDVLIIGAGPTGLVLALWLTRQGVTVRIIDKAEATVSTSRALAIHARTLELYRQLDLAEDVVSNGHKVDATNVWSNGQHKTRIPIGDIGKGLTPYPFIHIYPQDRHERLLEDRLNTHGVRVERFRELVGFTEHDTHITARLRDPRKEVEDDHEYDVCEATFIVGCDGAHSAVRHACEIGFDGAMYSQLFFVADIEGSGPAINGDAHVSFNNSEFVLLFAYDKDRRARIAGAVDEKIAATDISDITFEDVSTRAIKSLNLQIDKVNWFTTYRVHHRVSLAFQKGRAFLAGDAAHIHSPVGGQGMNTGIGDAINLAWKLTAVIKGNAGMSLLKTYEVERRAFATTLVNSTDSAFNFAISQGYIARFIRTWLIPCVAPIMSKLDFVRSRVFQGVSQVLVNYRHSNLSVGVSGSIHGGDRMPWAPVGDLDNFESLRAISWQVQVYGCSQEKMTDWCQSKGISLHVFPWDKKYQQVGLMEDAAYLVRPDTYVAVAEPSGLPQRFDQYLEDNNIRLTAS